MDCPACGHENRAGAKFCAACGMTLSTTLPCPSCGAENTPASRFCDECGTALTSGAGAGAGSPPPSPSSATTSPAPSGEQNGRAQPTSFANGRYEVRRFLGEGGKKLVYLAHDTLLDRDVAFALIKTEGLDAEGKERITREAQMMGRLGDHPNIVSVFDTGFEDGQPYLVSQLMGGGDVEGLIEQAVDNRLPLTETIRITSEVCRALEHAHSHDVVHRDLKPGNVWLTTDRTAKLGDFGLAISLERTRLTQAGMMVGTVSYMPPEQALGGEVTPRSDLYSLGAMLYEMVTGRPPFVGDESVAIITQHINVPPIAPTWYAPEVPPALDALIMRLLEKDPTRRPESAGEVRKILSGIETGRPHPSPLPLGEGAVASPSGRGRREAPGESIAPETPTPSTQPLAPGPLYQRVFVGRETELRQIQDAFDRACSGRGGMTLVVGEPGIGKTALCEQVSTYVAMRGGRSLAGSCYEEGSLSLPYLPFVEAIRSYVAARDPEALRAELGSGAHEVARIVSEVSQRLALTPALSQGARGEADPDDERWRLLQSVSGFLRAASAAQPLLMVLEDLQWADRGTLDLLTHLARNLTGARLLILGTYRDEDVDRAHPLASTLAELRRDAGFDRIALHGLTVDEVHRMVSAISGQEVSRRFSDVVHHQTEGNPLFVQEVIRYLVEAGFVVREGGRWQGAGSVPPEMNIPDGLREVIGKRLSRLSPTCNRVLSIAAVIGRDFALRALQAVAEIGEDELADALEEAVRVGVLQEQARVGGASYRFAHAFTRQTLYEELSLPRRLRLHQQVARVLEEQYEDRLEDHAAELAGHFAHSSDPKDLRLAVAYGEIAAQKAISVNAYGEAVRLLDQALEIQTVLDPDDRVRRCDLLLGLGQALLPAGDSRRAYEEIAPQALALAEGIANRDRAARAARLAIEAVMRHGGTGRGYRIGTTVQEWAQHADRYAEPGTRLRVYADCTLAMVQAGSLDATSFARQLASNALGLARQLDDPEALFWAAWTMMLPDWPPRYLDETLRLADEFTGRSREGVSTRTLDLVLRRGQMVFLAAGDRERVEQLWSDLDALSSRTQDANAMTWPEIAGSIRATFDGNLTAAVDAACRLRNRGIELGIPAVEQSAASLGAWPLIYLGTPADPDEAASRRNAASHCLALAHSGRTSDAREALRAALKRDDVLARDETPAPYLAYFLEAAVVLGERGPAAALAQKLGGTSAISSLYSLVNVARHRGGAAALLGEREAARAAYAEAFDWATRVRHRPEIALTRFQLAELLLSPPPPGEGQGEGVNPEQRQQELAEAQAHLDFAIEEFRAMKMRPSLERALRHKGLLHA